MSEHPAVEFRNLRSKYFAIANKHGFDKAFYILEKDNVNLILDIRDYTGLLCELIFFQKHYSDLDLDK